MAIVPLWDEGEGYKSFPVSRQRRLNAYIEQRSSYSNYSIQGADKTPIAVYGTPGLTLTSSTGANPVRGARTIIFLATTYLVAGSTVYTFNTAGVLTIIGTINSLSGRVTMTDNGTQLLLVDGVNGWIITLATNTLTQITDPNFPNGATTCTFLGGYFIVNKPGTGQFWWSNVYAGMNWNALQFATAEYDPDNLLAVTVSQGQLQLWGERTIELWQLSGDSRVFARIGGSAVEWGLGAVFSIDRFGDNMIYLAKNRMGQFQVAILQGSQSQPVSTAEIEFDLNMQSPLAGATAYSYLWYGHLMYQINFAGKSYLYDGTSNAWSEVGSNPLGQYPPGRHYGEVRFELASIPYVTDFRNGNIYKVDVNNFTDNGDPIIFETDLKHVFEPNLGFQTIDEFQIDMETGVGLSGSSAPNYGILFDGSTQYISVPVVAGNTLSGPITLMAWVYIVGVPTTNATVIRGGIAAAGGFDTLWSLRLDLASGCVAGLIRTNTGGPPGTVYSVVGSPVLTPPPPALQWTHWAMTYDPASTSIACYQNGVRGNFFNFTTGAISPAPTTIAIGAQPAEGAINPATFWPGVLDDVRIYKIAMTGAQILTASQSRPNPNDPNLVSAYEFDEGSGTTAIDLTGVSNGTLTNFGGTSNPIYVGGATIDNPVLGADPKVMFSVSRDGGRSFGNERQLAIGKQGNYYNKCFALGVGCSRDFVAKLKISDPVKRVFINPQLRIR